MGRHSYGHTGALRGFGRGVGAFVGDLDHAYFLTGSSRAAHARVPPHIPTAAHLPTTTTPVRDLGGHEDDAIRKDGVAVHTDGGWKLVGPSSYLELVEALRPDAVVALAPEVSCLASRKQATRAHQLSLSWLDTTLQHLHAEVRIDRMFHLLACLLD